jgi:hypothetical protein
MTSHIDLSVQGLSDREESLRQRAVAHCLAESVAGDATFRDGVDDLDAARLLLDIERGAIYIPNDPGMRSWHAIGGGRPILRLSRVVRECLRLGLVERLTVQTAPSIWRTQLQAAPVHMRTAGRHVLCRTDVSRPSKRLRSLTDPGLVDCAACVFLHR